MNNEPRPADLLRQQAKAERRLLRAEHRAERDLLDAQERLASAQLKFDKAQTRVERRRKRVASALDALQAAQAARAQGPDESVDEQPIAELPTFELATAISQPERDDSILPLPATTASLPDDDEPSDPRPTRRRKPRVTSAVSSPDGTS